MSMLSRIADNMFWLHRYMERADGMMLALRSSYILSFDKDLHDTLGYRPMLQAYTGLSPAEQEALEADTGALLMYVVADAANPNSMKTLIGRARENARGSQDKITKELWEQVNALYHYMNQPDLGYRLRGPEALSVLDYLQQQLLLYNGVVDSTMPRGLGWSFMNLGKYIERTIQTVNLTDAYLAHIGYAIEGPEDVIYWRRLLLSLSGYELYLKSNRGTAHNRQVICQAIFNKDFPRSVLYSLVRIDKYLADITEDNPIREALSLQKQFGRLRSLVEYTDPAQLDADGLSNLLHNVRQQTWDFSTAFGKLFFSYT